MPESRFDLTDIPEMSTALEKELATLGAEGAERILGVIRGLFHCIADLNKRVGDLEKIQGLS